MDFEGAYMFYGRNDLSEFDLIYTICVFMIICYIM